MHKKLRYCLLDVFTDRAFGGNQLAVFPKASGVSSELMQSIAKELNLSETTFVLPPEDPRNDCRVRIFTPAAELPMAGHPTIGTSFILAREYFFERSEEVTTLRLEEGVGPIRVDVKWVDGHPDLIEMTQPLPTFGSIFPAADKIADMLSLDPEAITDTDLPMQVVSCGVAVLFVPLRALQAAKGIRFRHDVWERVLQDFEAPHIFVFTRETEFPGSTVHSRMFAPALGISEDPATGGASGPLGCYLVRHRVLDPAPRVEFVSEQGLEIGRPSFINVAIEQTTEGEITSVRVGGLCHFMGEGFLEVQEEIK